MEKKQLVESPDFGIRYTTGEDESFLHKWLNAPGVAHWFSVQDASEIEELVKIWISFARFKCSLTATYRGQPCGVATLFLMPYVKLIHMSMGYILVDPSMQKKGIGGALIKNLDHLASSYFHLERMHYEVYGENPLVKLLTRSGYQIVFKQARYIKEEQNYLDRIVLEKVFKS